LNSIDSQISEYQWIPDGFHFLGFEESKRRRALLDKIYIFFREKGYEEVTPPSFDYTSSFQNFISKNEFQNIFKSRDFSGREISPSIDLTLQIVKGLANYSTETGSHKVFYTGKILKDSKKANADRREILQAGAEIIGHSNANSFKMLFSHIDLLHTELGLGEKITLVLGNVSIFKKIIEFLKFNKEESLTLSKLFYTKNQTSIQDFFAERNIAKDIQSVLLKMIFNFSIREMNIELQKLSELYNLDLEKHLVEAQELYEFSIKLENIDLCIDYSLISDLEYYTGFVFQGYYSRLPYPICMGGAYDHLFQKFSNVEKKACGFAINLDLIEEEMNHAR
jgi:ATP phosphoribosyltransferase regulatory subunit